MTDSDPDIIYSRLCREVTQDGITVRVEIYRIAANPKWALEVTNELESSTIWDELFDTDVQACEAFEEVLADEGIGTFLGGGDAETLH